MRMHFGVLAVCVLGGCAAPPVQLRSAPTPTAQDVVQTRAVQTRVIATPIDAVLPRAIEILFDNGYVVRAADGQLGFLAFYQQWSDPTQSGANISEEGSMLFKSAGAQSTQIRIMLTGGWQRYQATGGGTHSTDFGMVSGVQEGAGADEYKKLLDLLEAGLGSPKPQVGR
jgi:hypothetical protein